MQFICIVLLKTEEHLQEEKNYQWLFYHSEITMSTFYGNSTCFMNFHLII